MDADLVQSPQDKKSISQEQVISGFSDNHNRLSDLYRIFNKFKSQERVVFRPGDLPVSHDVRFMFTYRTRFLPVFGTAKKRK
jgi:hypothetical protein